jgi:hypothetical protein
MRIILIVILFLAPAALQSIYGQVFSFGGDGLEEASDILVCENQDILLVGTTSSDTENAANIYILRTDTNFQCIWSLSLGGPGIETGVTVVENADQELLVVGNTSSTSNNGYGIMVWLLSASGEILWSTTYGGADWDFATHAVVDPDGSYWITGRTFSFGNGASDALLLHVLPDGSVINQWTYGTAVHDEFVDLDFLNDGTMLLTGNQRTDDTTCLGWLATINDDGILSNFNFFGNDTLSAYIHHTLVHGDYIVHCGHTYQNGVESSYLRRLYQNGNVDWERLEYQEQPETYYHVILRNNDYFIASQSEEIGAGGSDALLYRRSQGGWFQDAMFYGVAYDDAFVSLVDHPNGWLYAVGQYANENGSTHLIAYKQPQQILSSENIGEQTPIGCFSVDVQNSKENARIIATYYFNWLGQQQDILSLPSCYIKKDILADGHVNISKICRSEVFEY